MTSHQRRRRQERKEASSLSLPPRARASVPRDLARGPSAFAEKSGAEWSAPKVSLSSGSRPRSIGRTKAPSPRKDSAAQNARGKRESLRPVPFSLRCSGPSAGPGLPVRRRSQVTGLGGSLPRSPIRFEAKATFSSALVFPEARESLDAGLGRPKDHASAEPRCTSLLRPLRFHPSADRSIRH